MIHKILYLCYRDNIDTIDQKIYIYRMYVCFLIFSCIEMGDKYTFVYKPPVYTFPDNFVVNLLNELNMVRKNPRSYIPYIQAQEGKGYNQADINETISFLNQAGACTSTLTINSMLSSVAQHWVDTQGGGIQCTDPSCTGHGNFVARVSGAGTYQAIAENLSYGHSSPRDNIIAWIIDAGVQGKGHRVNIFNCNYTQLGIGFGTHKTYYLMVDTIFAKGFIPK